LIVFGGPKTDEAAQETSRSFSEGSSACLACIGIAPEPKKGRAVALPMICCGRTLADGNTTISEDLTFSSFVKIVNLR
jgi:hypothetical protein